MRPPETWSSAASRRADIATVAPRATSSRAVAAPMPLDAPTTQTTFPRKFTRMPA